MEQTAAEPLVHSPVAIAFDENGRMYVVEMIDYSEQDKEFLGAVRVLEDTDGDGRFDKSTVLADKLSWPTAIACYDGGVFVGAAPDIYYLKDTDGDGKADIRKTVFTGFGRSNVQGLFNSFLWGLDNRIHGATSSSGAQVVRADVKDAKPVVVSGRDFAFDPRTLELVPTSGGAQHGMSFDDWGRKFLSSNSDHIQLVMYEERYLARNKYLAASGPRASIAADGPQAEVFRISPVEPWRIVRTRLRMSAKVPGPVEGGGRAAGYFTGATGVTIYRGDAWPAEYRGQAFVGDVGSNIVHRKVLEPDGVGLVARRVDEKKEFVASTDIWFRPAQFANAPDGNLYIIDVYREVIEHPASLPPPIKKHLDLTSGRDRGRIYRVTHDGFKQRPLPRLGKATTAELVATLAHRNGWHRDTAARLLFEPIARRTHARAVCAGRPGGALGGSRLAPHGRRKSARSRARAQTFGDAGVRFA
jgi:putative membrane-bound dehydrogenase-like protein